MNDDVDICPYCGAECDESTSCLDLQACRSRASRKGVRERAAIVAWLRDPSACSERYDDDEERADAIERGEHLV